MTNNNIIDLHMHTTYSADGTYQPEELMAMCKEVGLQVVAIADHNSTKGIVAGRRAAEKLGLKYINAVEIDCQYHDCGLHVLAYGIKDDDQTFNKFGQDIENQEIAIGQEKIALTEKMGFEVNRAALQALSPNGVYTGEMFAEVLLNDPRYLDHPLLKPYRPNGKRSDNPYVNFFWDFYAAGKPCDVSIQLISLTEVLAAIKKSGGISVLAHPGNNLKGHFEMFDEMVSEGLEGVEAFSNYHQPEVCDYFYQKALQYQLLYTVGSDFHGKTKPSIKLGQAGCFVDEQLIIDNLKHWHLL